MLGEVAMPATTVVRDERKSGDRIGRRTERTAVLKGARVQAPDRVSVRCTVRDVSMSGARVDGPITADFFLLSFDDPGWPQKIACEVVWRADQAMGVNFLGTKRDSDGFFDDLPLMPRLFLDDRRIA